MKTITHMGINTPSPADDAGKRSFLDLKKATLLVIITALETLQAAKESYQVFLLVASEVQTEDQIEELNRIFQSQ